MVTNIRDYFELTRHERAGYGPAMPDRTAIHAQWIKWIRAERDLQYTALSKILDVRVETLSRWAHGHANPTDANWLQVVDFLGISVSEYWQGPYAEHTKRIAQQLDAVG